MESLLEIKIFQEKSIMIIWPDGTCIISLIAIFPIKWVRTIAFQLNRQKVTKTLLHNTKFHYKIWNCKLKKIHSLILLWTELVIAVQQSPMQRNIIVIWTRFRSPDVNTLKSSQNSDVYLRLLVEKTWKSSKSAIIWVR